MTNAKNDSKADVRSLRPIGWIMGGVTAVCAVMAVATGYWTQQQARGDFNRHASVAAPAASFAAQAKAPRMTVPFKGLG